MTQAEHGPGQCDTLRRLIARAEKEDDETALVALRWAYANAGCNPITASDSESGGTPRPPGG